MSSKTISSTIQKNLFFQIKQLNQDERNASFQFYIEFLDYKSLYPHSDMSNQGGHFQFCLSAPTISLIKVFNDIKTMQKDNLSDMPIESKDQKQEQQIKGLKFIAKKIKILLQKNKKIEYNQASRILINNFASEEKAERNIKRRVYDAINVLVSAGVITKDDTKIQLVHERKQNCKNSKNMNTKNKIASLAQSVESIGSRLHKKKQQLNKVKLKIDLLKRIYIEKTKKIKKQSLGQQIFTLSWNGKIEEVILNKKKKGNVTIRGGKLKQTHKDLLKFLCQAEMKEKQEKF